MEKYELSLHQADRFLYHMGHDDSDVREFDRVSIQENAAAWLSVEEKCFRTYELLVEGDSSVVVFSGEMPETYNIGDELEV